MSLGGSSATRVVRNKRSRGDEPASPTSGGGGGSGMGGESGTAGKPSQMMGFPVAWVGDRVGACHYVAALFGGRMYHVNDTVLLQSGIPNTPFVCRIERMSQKGPRKVMQVRWFYRASDIPDVVNLLQRQPFEGEVFMTDVVEENDVSTILQRCYVQAPEKFARTVETHGREVNLFCCSLFYHSQHDRFLPIQSVSSAGVFMSDPPAKAPRLNMPLQPNGQVITYDVYGGGVLMPAPKSKSKKRGGLDAGASAGEGIVCCINNCANICWTKRPRNGLLFDWTVKANSKGTASVCSEHYHMDRALGNRGVKRPWSEPNVVGGSGDEDSGTSSGSGSGGGGGGSRSDSDSNNALDPALKKRSSGSMDESSSSDFRKNRLRTRGVVVYQRDASSTANILGEIIIHPRTTLAEVRKMITEELALEETSFVLRKNSIPLPRNQDSKLACWFFSAADDVLIVHPNC